MKRHARTIPAIALLLTVAACHRESPVDAGSTNVSTAAPATAATSSVASSTAVAPSKVEATSNAFDVEVTLSPAAHKRLASQGESLIVSAEYFGYPSDLAEEQHVPGSENPWLTLHRAQLELEGAQLGDTATARFPAVALDAKQLAWTNAPGAPQVNINVYSGRRSSPDNLLECGMFQGAIAVAARAPIKVSCGLIGEKSH